MNNKINAMTTGWLMLCIILFTFLYGCGSDYDFWSLSSNYADIPTEFADLVKDIAKMEQGATNAPTGEITYDSTEIRFERYDGSGYDLLDLAEIGSTSEITVEIMCSAEAVITMYPEGVCVFNEGSRDRNLRIEGDSDANLFFCDAGNDRAGIGTASPANILHVFADNADTGNTADKSQLILEQDGAGDASVQFELTGSQSYAMFADNSDGNDSIKFYDITGTQTFYQYDPSTGYTSFEGGNVGIGTAAPGEALEVNGTIECIAVVETSDERLKENIKDISGTSTTKIKQLRPCKWDWKDREKGSGVGFIAQELETVIPEAVVTHPEIINEETGEIVKVEKKGIVPTVILMHLVKTIQELEARIKALEK